MSPEQQVQRVSGFTSAIWQVHPFGKRNTITTAVFIKKYLSVNGWDVNNDLFKDNSKYFRDALVLSNYANMKKGIEPNKEYLISFFYKLLLDPSIELKLINKEKVTDKK